MKIKTTESEKKKKKIVKKKVTFLEVILFPNQEILSVGWEHLSNRGTK